MSEIRILPDHIINRIAAGEVVERPAGALKELIENSIDAKATRIIITIEGGGKSSFIIEDNGKGIKKEELSLALTRHATSKINKNNGEDDLINLEFFGFRGEALASLAAISDLILSSKHKDFDTAFQISADAGILDEIKPTSLGEGTVIKVEKLFHPVPARLKFLKSDRSEQSAITDMVKRLAMANPNVGFTLKDSKRVLLHLNPLSVDDKKQRISDILGSEFSGNSMFLDYKHDDIKLTGMASIPTYHRGNGLQQYLYVNGRSVKDKMLTGILRAAYAEHLARDRYPICVLFIEVPAEDVDVNVHPTKAEVRFRKDKEVRSMVISSIRDAISNIGHTASSHNTQKAIEVMANKNDISSSQSEKNIEVTTPTRAPVFQSSLPLRVPKIKSSFKAQSPLEINERKNQKEETTKPPISIIENQVIERDEAEEEKEDIPPLGYAKGQVHQTYIISQTDQDMIIVDQHAAHERIILEKVKDGLKQGGLKAQNLLLPEIVTLDENLVHILSSKIDDLEKFGLAIETFGINQILVRSVPSFLLKADIKKLIKDIADDFADSRGADSLTERINLICATFACHHSIRAGRNLTKEEMNHLLRDMEQTEGAGQCNHGRPTYIKLAKNDIERLFGRK